MKMKLAECSETSAYNGVWILYADVSEHSVPSSVIIHLLAYEDEMGRVFRNVSIYNSDAGELPRRKHTTYLTMSAI